VLNIRWDDVARVFTHLEHTVEQIRQVDDFRRTSYCIIRRLHMIGLRRQHNGPCSNNTAMTIAIPLKTNRFKCRASIRYTTFTGRYKNISLGCGIAYINRRMAILLSKNIFFITMPNIKYDVLLLQLVVCDLLDGGYRKVK